jgi:hypothetical protein
MLHFFFLGLVIRAIDLLGHIDSPYPCATSEIEYARRIMRVYVDGSLMQLPSSRDLEDLVVDIHAIFFFLFAGSASQRQAGGEGGRLLMIAMVK